MKNANARFPKIGTTLIAFMSLSIVWAFIPEDLRNQDPIRSALYHTEEFQGHIANVPNPPADAKQKLLSHIQSGSAGPDAYRALAHIEIQLHDFAAAETHFKEYVLLSTNKDRAYGELEKFYHDHLKFDLEFQTVIEHAKLLEPQKNDSSLNQGPYFHYHRALKLIDNYGLKNDPAAIHESLVQLYPSDSSPFLDFIQYRIDQDETEAAAKLLELYKSKFPEDEDTYLLTKTKLLDSEESFRLLNESYKPLWNMNLVRALDQAAASANKKVEYLESLKDRLEKNPGDFDAAVRLFHAYYLAGNPAESGNVLNDYRLLKDKLVQGNKGSWPADELFIMARLQHEVKNLNEAARFYYALYTDLRSGGKTAQARPADALYGLFQILAEAGERPIQIGAGNIDFYKDIAAADHNPGFLNGILSLILNGIDIPAETAIQESHALGYYNRAQAYRLLRIVQRDYPEYENLPAMYSAALEIFETYGMDELIVKAGNDFFQKYSNTTEVLAVAVAVTDACARMKDTAQEWKTYEMILPIAAKQNPGTLIGSQESARTDYEDEYGDEYTDEESYDDSYKPERKKNTAGSHITYEFLLKRYINSLTLSKNYEAVLRLYRDQIAAHPDEEGLYENFTAYLVQNQLSDEEADVYRKAIQQFQSRSWYEKLARWYLRRERNEEFQKISEKIIDLFSATEAGNYLDSVIGSSNPYRQLYIGLNHYAHDRFPHNLKFVQNLRRIYSSTIDPDWQKWEKLSAEYYFVNEEIRTEYFRWLAKNGNLPQSATATNTIQKRFQADLQIWRSHFEEALPVYSDLVKTHSSDMDLNVRTADLKRSLGVYYPEYYAESSALREHLAKITPSDSSLWTTAGETLAEIEEYQKARDLWENIIKIDPQNQDRYLEVATILWDYYLFEDALSIIGRARQLKDSPSLFAYEAGAIYESKRDYTAAIAEYSKSLIEDSGSASNRLTELYRRRNMKPIIRTHLDKLIQQNSTDPEWWTGIIHFYADQKEAIDVRDLLKKSLTLNKETFLEAVPGLKSACQRFGFNDIHEELIRKQIAYAVRDIDTMYLTLELARFYEAQMNRQEAQKTYQSLYEKNPYSAGFISELTSFYWRTENYDRAFAVYKDAIAVSNSKFKKLYLKEATNRYRERKQYDQALAASTALLAEDPLESQAFALTARIYAEKADYAGLAAHYKSGLQGIKESTLTEVEKKERTASLRRGIIQANTILKDYTAAIDQYIEVINRDAESDPLLREAAEYAAAHGLTDRLIAYYQNTAASSPRDHRWPFVLGKLYLFSGNFDQAIASFQNAIAIRPERSDLHELLADTFQRSGNYDQAIQTYERLYTLTYKDKRWLTPMAELHARTGNQKKALELYEQTLNGSEELADLFQIAQKALSWGMPKSAIAYGNSGLKKYYADMSQWLPADGLAAMAEAQIQTGQPALAFQTVHQVLRRIHSASENATYETEELRSSEYSASNVLVSQLPALIKKYLSGDSLQELNTQVLEAAANSNSEWKTSRLLPFARASGLARAEEQILIQLASEYFAAPEFVRYKADLRRFYYNRHAFTAYAKWLEEDWRKRPRVESRDDLVEIANAYRLGAQHQDELRILREYYQWITSAGLQSQAVNRYLELLYSNQMRDELKKAAAIADYNAANFFVLKKDEELIQITIDAIAKHQKPVWRTTQSAMLGRELHASKTVYDQNFIHALDIRTIGDHLQNPSNSETSLLGNDWFYYGKRYGEYLNYTGQEQKAALYLTSELEGSPLRDYPQFELANFYKNENKNHDAAYQHFRLASVLQPENPEYIDEMARSLHALNKKDEAVAAWTSLKNPQSAYRMLVLARAALEFDFFESVRSDLENYLDENIRKSGASGLSELIAVYLSALPEDQKVQTLKRWIPSAPAPRYFGAALLRLSDFDQRTLDVVYGEVQQYLRTSAAGAGGQQLRITKEELVEWTRNYAAQLLEWKQYQRAFDTARDALTIVKADQSTSRFEETLVSIQVRSLLRLAKTADAFNLASTYVRKEDHQSAEETTPASVNVDRYRRMYELLKEEQAATEANVLLQESYERLISSGQTSSANYLGLAEIKIEQKKIDEAKALLNRMIYSESENLDSFSASAALLEKHELYNDAAGYRMTLEKRMPWNMANRAQLANDLLKTGNKTEAAARASRVLRSGLSSLESELQAAIVYAAAAKDATGSNEIQKIQIAARGNTTPAPLMYEMALRSFLLDRSSPKLDLILAQLYLLPSDLELQQKLFTAYKENGMCEQALLAIDPDFQSRSQYEVREGQQRGRIFGDDNYDSYDPSDYYPIREWNLPASQTMKYALEAEECARLVGEHRSRIFYLTMALRQAEPEERPALQQRIEHVEEEMEQKEEAERKRWKIAANLGRQS